jgi:deoxyribonuclease V
VIRHDWDITPKRAVRLQRELAERVRIVPLQGPVKLVGGVDCAFSDDDRVLAVAVLCDAETMDVLHTSRADRPCEFPYIGGLLSFREAPAVIAAVESLPHRPDLLLCDGQGVAHPRGMGLASHVGLWLDVPTIGVAKSRLCGEHREPAAARGSRAALKFEGRRIGTVLRTRDGVRPLYVSVGHRITLDDAVRWTLRCGRGVRMPEPTRQADRLVSIWKKRLRESS